MGQLEVKPISIDQFVGRLETEKGFSFARYGDGSFLSLRGIEGWNCDGAECTIRQAEEIETSILDETITHGIGDLSLSVGKAQEWIDAKGVDIEWYDCNVMNTASHSGRLLPFIKWLRKRKIVMLGPSHLRRLRAFPTAEFIEVHPTLAFDQLEDIHIIAEYSVERVLADTVLISAGPAAPPLVSKLHGSFPFLNVIDTGSIWDPYVGVLSRKIHKKMGKRQIRDLGRLNFNMEISSWWAT